MSSLKFFKTRLEDSNDLKLVTKVRTMNPAQIFNKTVKISMTIIYIHSLLQIVPIFGKTIKIYNYPHADPQDSAAKEAHRLFQEYHRKRVPPLSAADAA